MERKGEEAVGEVQLAVPAVRCGLLGCVIDGGVGEVFVLQMVVEVAGQVDDESRLLPSLMMACRGWTPNGRGWSGERRRMASNSMYSCMRVRTAATCCVTVKVLSWSVGTG